MFTCYLDESGTDDLSPTAVVAGFMMNEPRLDSFDTAWRSMLQKHHILSIHMKEFRQHGKLHHLTVEQRRALFADVVPIINDHKNFSVAGTLTTAEYDAHLSSLFDRKMMGVYGACFLLCVVTNHKLAEHSQFQERVSYLLDNGNPYRHHILEGYKTILEFQRRERWLNVGALGFDDDEKTLALQAADVISWTVRRSASRHFPPGFEELEKIKENSEGSPHHVQHAFTDELLRMLADSLRKRVLEDGRSLR
jgi:hypothetical protein